jgi:hypothetical protein
MKFMIGVFIVLGLCGCEEQIEHDRAARSNTTGIGAMGVVRVFEDKDRNVTCWIARDNTGIAISCLRNEK